MSASHQYLEHSHAAHASASPSPPRRDLEDADNFTRKRQRLDDGGAVLHAMSTDPESPSKAITSPHKEMVAMTIREHSPPSPSPAADAEHDPIATGALADQLPTPTMSPAMVDGAADDCTSPPLIEIIDDDDEGSPSDLTVQLDVESYFKLFPYRDRFRSDLHTLRIITEHLHQNKEIPPDLLPLLAQWLQGLPEDAASRVQTFFVGKAIFWTDFADLVESILKQRYHWMKALEANHDDMSRYPFGEAFGDDLVVDEVFSTFFSAYMKLCSQLLSVDVHLLNRPRREELYASPLLSEKHLVHLHTVLCTEKSPLFHVLRRQHAVDIQVLSSRLHTDFLTANGAQNLLRLADEVFHSVSSTLQDQISVSVCQILGTLGWTICRFPDARGGIDPGEYYRGTLLFFQKFSKDLQDPARVTDAGIARGMISCFSALIQEICQWDEVSSNILVDELLDTPQQSSPAASSSSGTQASADLNTHGQYSDFLPVILANTWKLTLLRRFIVKGKMELRLMSISFMEEALVKLYEDYNGGSATNKHPVLKHLADVLLRSRAVDYILSVDSHPQLLSRSGNVLGFLLVTDRWTDDQADAIWNIVSSSPDPRMVTAAVTMLRSITRFTKPVQELYFCMKLYELPIASYTPEILSFLGDLTTKLLDRGFPVDWSLRDETARPWNVCVQLLQSTAPRSGATKHELEINTDVNEQLRRMARSIPEYDQRSIYKRCLHEIVARSEKVTGSVRVIFILCTLLDSSVLQQNTDMVRQIVEELPIFVDSESKTTPHQHQLLALQYRLDLLRLLVCEVGQAISQALYIPIWDHIVGPQALSNQARNLAWTRLFQATRAVADNDFCRQLISVYVPTMNPSYFTPGLYDFVANYEFPLSKKVVQIDGVDHSLLQIPGGDLLWSLALSSPPGTIEESSARDLALRYTHVPQSQDVAVSDVEAAHIELVERCMNELRSALKVLHATFGQDSQENELRFSRVLMFLRQMLELVRQRPEFNRGRRADSKVESMDIGIPAADSINIRYQVGGDRQNLVIAPDRTIADLYRILCQATNCSKINLFAGGQKLNVAQRADQRIVDANIGGQLLVQPVQRDESAHAVSAPAAGSSEFETNLVKHFDEMFSWLDTNDAINQLLFDFLTLFPYRSTITNSVAVGDATCEILFPPGRLFQTRYAVQALHSKLKDQLRSSALDEIFLVNTIKLLDRALLSADFSDDEASSASGLPLAAVFISAMSDFLRERPSSGLSKEYFSDETALADRLSSMLVAFMRTGATKVTQECYATIIEASLYSPVIWNTLWKHPEITQIHRTLLLTDPHGNLRRSIKLKILSVCGGHLPSSCPLSTADIVFRYWKTIADILPGTVLQADRSDQLFELAYSVFRVYDEHHRSEENLRSLLQDWGSWLLAYNHTEVPGRYEVDNVVLGFTKLLGCLVPSLKSYKRPLNAGGLISHIFQKFLFISPSSAESVTQEDDLALSSLPILDSSARREIYDLLLALVDDSHSFERLLGLISDVENRQVDNVLPTSVDRAVEVRSRTGYVGLYNPRAICYMNSLMAQLFMNLNFRQFMLGLEVKDGDGSQRLLLETQKLFATMQNSYRRSADPRPFAECIQTLDKTPIDISVQMDADEFYNLLFDQWEAQLLSPHDKRLFRSFYGGQMLQQVKSKECEHVSERADSFFALQCDVQGKANLQESLQAFVQGDVMEGDNKYKCESCGGKFVDAVKRTCLKSAPDNLIFHLKRFDFDFTDFSRKKVNEHFAFPESIDIGLYNVDHLSDPSNPHKEDPFDLVGVVVHFGNCENGHYYSYIRKRPTPSSDGSSTWLNFNDELVDPFDPTEIPQKAFGGLTESTYNRQYKMYSAYMLFYQRRSAIISDEQRWTASSQAQPLKVDVSRSVEAEIDIKNDVFVREYCLFDPHHSAFIRHLHGMSRGINNGTCSDNHQHEKLALGAFLAHLGRVVWRQQTTDIFDEALNHLRRCVSSCKSCCNIALQFFAQDDEILHNLVLRCPHPSIRSQTRSFLVDSLEFMREKDDHLYSTTADDSGSEPDSETGLIVSITQRLASLAESSSKHTRAWDDLYLLLTQVVEMGPVETAALLDTGALTFCLGLLCMNVRPRFAEKYIDFYRIFQKRMGIYNGLIGFTFSLLSRMDLDLPTCNSPERLQAMNSETMALPFTADEKNTLLCWHNENKAYAVIDKMTELFDQTKAVSFYPGDVVRWIMESQDDRIQRNMVIMLVQGIGELHNPFCDQYLRVAISYCEVTKTSEGLSKVFNAVVEAITRIDPDSSDKMAPSGGAALRFFQQLFRLHNQHLSTTDVQWPPIAACHRYASVLLLHPDGDVRIETQDFIHDLFREHLADSIHLDGAYRCARATIATMTKRILYELEAGMPRKRLQPLLETGEFLVSLIHNLDQSEDPDLVDFRSKDDAALLQEWQIEVEARVRALPEANLQSPGERMFDSEYASDSDDVELLDP